MTSKIARILGLLLIVDGIFGLAIDGIRSQLFNLEYVDVLLSNIICVVMVIAGFFVIRNRKPNLMRDVGIVTMLVVLDDLVGTVFLILPILDKPVDVLSFVILGAFVVAGIIDIFIILFATRYMMGHRRNAVRIAICLTIPLAMVAIASIVGIATYWNDWNKFFETFGTYLPLLLIYSVLIFVLLLPSVREEFTEWKVYKISEKACSSVRIDPESSVYRRDLLIFAERMENPEKWKDSELVPNAKTIHLDFGARKDYILTVRKMDGSDRMRLSVIPADAKEYTGYTKFDLNAIVPRDGTMQTCRMVRFYGFDGEFIDIRVRDDNPSVPKGFAIDRLLHRFSRKKS